MRIRWSFIVCSGSGCEGERGESKNPPPCFTLIKFASGTG